MAHSVDLSTRLPAILAAQHLSQREVSRRMGISPTMMPLWVKGKRAVPAAQIEPLARALGVSVDDLLGQPIVEQIEDRVDVAAAAALDDRDRADAVPWADVAVPAPRRAPGAKRKPTAHHEAPAETTNGLTQHPPAHQYGVHTRTGELLTTAEAAIRLGRERSRMRRLVEQGRVVEKGRTPETTPPPRIKGVIKKGGVWLVPDWALADFAKIERPPQGGYRSFIGPRRSAGPRKRKEEA